MLFEFGVTDRLGRPRCRLSEWALNRDGISVFPHEQSVALVVTYVGMFLCPCERQETVKHKAPLCVPTQNDSLSYYD